MSKLRQLAESVAKEAGALLKSRVGKIKSIDYKSAFNLVTDVDKASEELIVRTIKGTFPDDGILGEEGGEELSSSSSRRWIIDPLDGTTNYTHSYPFFAVSIGVEENGVMVLGVVYNPMADELFVAERGQGAVLNGEKLTVSKEESLGNSLLATGFPPDTLNNMYNNLESFKYLTSHCHGVRRDGSAALDLCFVAAGRLDGFWERKLAPWDVAAGSLIVEEAGGTVSNLEGGALELASGHILASNGLIHQQVIDSLARVASTIS
ncbi:MAG: inositol monophosphatase [Cyanobacteria bacterium SZAS LIN-3]|nr:inositol monophosphatase [Cyanobacteria bacterium SZAS LIN-3]